jgi:hypothetical protein
LLKMALSTNQPTNQPLHAQSSVYKEKIINIESK